MEYSRRCVSVERLVRAAESVRLLRERPAALRSPCAYGPGDTATQSTFDTPTTQTTFSSTATAGSLPLESTCGIGGTSGCLLVGDSIGAASRSKSNDQISLEEDVPSCGAVTARAQKQRDVVCMERCLLEQWFCDGFTIPLPIKVQSHPLRPSAMCILPLMPYDAGGVSLGEHQSAEHVCCQTDSAPYPWRRLLQYLLGHLSLPGGHCSDAEAREVLSSSSIQRRRIGIGLRAAGGKSVLFSYCILWSGVE